MKNNLIIFTVIYLFWNGILFSDEVPRFLPEPLFIDISDHRNLVDVNGRYVVFGQSFVGVFLKIQPFSKKGDYTQEADLFQFISYISDRYKNVKSVSDIMEFTYVENHDLFEDFFRNDKNTTRAIEIYHSLDYMEYIIGWFHSDDIYCAYMQMHKKNGQATRNIMTFTFRTGEWKVLSGLNFSSQLMQDVTMAGIDDDLSKKVRVTTVPDALSAIKERVLSERITVKTDFPVLLQ